MAHAIAKLLEGRQSNIIKMHVTGKTYAFCMVCDGITETIHAYTSQGRMSRFYWCAACQEWVSTY